MADRKPYRVVTISDGGDPSWCERTAALIAELLANAYPDTPGIRAEDTNVFADEDDKHKRQLLRAWAAGFVVCLEHTT